MSRRRWFTIVLVSSLGAAWVVALPPPPTVTDVVGPAPVRGAIHVHTRLSDGTGTRDSVAAAAAEAGLQFVIVTDHGNGMRPPEAPAYRHGVLVLDSLEVTTDEGHLVALGLPAAPYPLGGLAGDVVEDVHRLGGLAIAAHPDSARPSLRWSGWDAPIDGLEWLNADSQWRDETRTALVRTLFTYPFRGAASLATLLDRPAPLLERWDALITRRPLVAVAASDAHARIGGGDPQTLGGRLALPLPSYLQTFRALSIALPGVSLTGDGLADARLVLTAIREGHVYSAIDALAGPGVLAFEATSGNERAIQGDSLAIRGPVEMTVTANAPAGGQIVLLRNGAEVTRSGAGQLTYTAPPESGSYRVEVRLADAPGSPPVPWLLSNPIYVGLDSPPAAARSADLSTARPTVYHDGPATRWRIEKSAQAEGRLDVVPAVDGTQILLRYGLGGAESDSPYVAAVVPIEGAVSAGAVRFLARAVRPSRLSVQLRTASGSRWRRSVYLDETARSVEVPFEQMAPVVPAAGSLQPGEIRDLLFVVDTRNTAIGASGQIWLDEVSIE